VNLEAALKAVGITANKDSRRDFDLLFTREEAMHEPLKGRIEDYLHGGKYMPDVEQHLANCPSCRAETAEMKKQVELFRSLKFSEELELDAGFYSRVMNRIETQAKPSIWNIFGESVFAKRLAYASLTFVVLLGTYFVSSTATDQQFANSSPEMLMSDDQHPAQVEGTDPQKDREAVLVNLATYQE
jgi:anti-sigma factor RsiW